MFLIPLMCFALLFKLSLYLHFLYRHPHPSTTLASEAYILWTLPPSEINVLVICTETLCKLNPSYLQHSLLQEVWLIWACIAVECRIVLDLTQAHKIYWCTQFQVSLDVTLDLAPPLCCHATMSIIGSIAQCCRVYGEEGSHWNNITLEATQREDHSREGRRGEEFTFFTHPGTSCATLWMAMQWRFPLLITTYFQPPSDRWMKPS